MISDKVNNHIFISYARTDGVDEAVRLCQSLKESGFRTWRDERNLNPYQDFSVEIERAIKQANHVIVCLTPSIAKRNDSFVRREILYAQGCSKPITPLLFPGFPQGQIPVLINNLTWIGFFDKKRPSHLNFLGGLSQLLERLSQDIHFVSPSVIFDPFREYLERLFKDIVTYLDATVYSLITLSANQTSEAISSRNEARALPISFFSSALKVKELSSHGADGGTHLDNLAAAFKHTCGRLLLLGEPGAGKTTALMAFAREVTAKRLEDPNRPLPIIAKIADWPAKKNKPAALYKWLAKTLAMDEEVIKHEMNSRGTILLLDGLDELPSSKKENGSAKILFMKEVGKCSDANQIIVTCRLKDYQEIGEKIALRGAVTLSPLSDIQISEYLESHPELHAALQNDQELLHIARTPLLLSILTFAYSGIGAKAIELTSLSDSPNELRDKIFQTFVRRRYEHEQLKPNADLPFTLDKMYDVLGRAAFESTKTPAMSEPYLNLKTKDVTDSVMSSLGDRSHMLISQARRLNLLVFDEKHRLQFIHRLLRDHFSLAHILSREFTSEDNVIAVSAASLLRDIGDHRGAVLLIAFLKHPFSDVRAWAAMALGKIGGEAAISSLIEHLGDSEKWDNTMDGLNRPVFEEVNEALKSIGDPAKNLLIDALQDEQSLVRANAAKILGELKCRRSVAPIIELLDDDNEDVRENAVRALARIGDANVVEPIIELLQNKGIKDREAVITGFKNIANDRAVEGLVWMLIYSGRNAACEALGQLKAVRALPEIRAAWLARLLRDDTAALALEYIGTDEAKKILEECKEKMSIPAPQRTEERSWVPRVQNYEIPKFSTADLHRYLRIAEDFLRKENHPAIVHEIKNHIYIAGVELYWREVKSYIQGNK
jgi:hypothetical protein